MGCYFLNWILIEIYNISVWLVGVCFIEGYWIVLFCDLIVVFVIEFVYNV